MMVKLVVVLVVAVIHPQYIRGSVHGMGTESVK